MESQIGGDFPVKSTLSKPDTETRGKLDVPGLEQGLSSHNSPIPVRLFPRLLPMLWYVQRLQNVP